MRFSASPHNLQWLRFLILIAPHQRTSKVYLSLYLLSLTYPFAIFLPLSFFSLLVSLIPQISVAFHLLPSYAFVNWLLGSQRDVNFGESFFEID